MRLKSLEIKGFKSFGDKVTIHFDEGVTAIVGPNGSGKSNVVDAMRWVLGEQKTRMLRSEKMENIIFNGTKTRKPANLAEVSLSFDNDKGVLPTEYSTLTLTRRLYRSGESEYQLNGITCRLKDINDLFLDTGIGPDSYAIIELNMVDDILKDRNNTIKTLLEEAAGITKYKIRKKQTFQKLEETDSDLNRVNDLLFEIEKSLKQLESQAKKTDRYYKLREEYKTLSTQLAVFSIRNQSQKLVELQEKEQSQQQLKHNFTEQLEILENKIQDLKVESTEKETNLQAVQKSLNEKILEITRFENEEKSRNERLNFLIEKQKQLERQTEQDSNTLIEVTSTLNKLNEDKAREEEHYKKIEEDVLRLRNESDESKKLYEQSLISIKELNQQIYQQRSLINEFETKQAVRHTRYNSISEELKRLLSQQEENRSRLASLENELSELLPKKDKADEELKKMKQLRLELDEKVKVLEVKVRELNQVLQAESRKLDARHNEYQLTKNLLEQMEGYPESIRYLKKNHTKFKQASLLSEIIVCDDEFKVTIENYLDPYLNHFVVDTMEEAWEALNVLNESAKGRAHFFVLESLKNFQSSSTSVNGCVHALDAIEKDEKYNKLFQMLLGHVHILNDERSLHDLAIDSDQSIVVLSKGGNFLRQRYTIGGGSVGSFEGKRTGKFRNLEKLAEEIKQFEIVIGEYRDQIKEADAELAEIKQKIQQTQQQVREQESEFMRLSGQVNSLQSNRDFLSNNLAQAKIGTDKIEEELGTIHQVMEAEKENPELSPEMLRQRLDNLMQQLNVQQEESQNLQKESSDKSQTFNQQNIVLLQQQNRIQNIIRELGYKTNESATLEKNKEQYSVEILSVKAQTDQLLSGLENSGDTLKAQVEEKIVLEELFKEAEKGYLNSKLSIEADEKKLHEFRRTKEQTDSILQNVYDELNELKLQMNSLKERLSIEFNIEIADLSNQEPDPELNEEEIRPRAEQLRKRVGEFGPINPMALEQYKEIKERYDFIIKEKNDLNDAKEALLKTINEIDETAKTVFVEAFTQVRDNFIMVFRSLFTDDDNCDLIISDPANPLESDIQIIAQPKGKKPLSIHQLSGGEKTLTATALLFGIYLLKPAPFCIFDEVDAPLDDNNIDKFNNIIKKFSDQSQFIVITHNKKTMAATDLMYGITMAEPGVTTVVPVDLRSYAE
jgi:chromosome segregation protein